MTETENRAATLSGGIGAAEVQNTSSCSAGAAAVESQEAIQTEPAKLPGHFKEPVSTTGTKEGTGAVKGPAENVREYPKQAKTKEDISAMLEKSYAAADILAQYHQSDSLPIESEPPDDLKDYIAAGANDDSHDVDKRAEKEEEDSEDAEPLEESAFFSRRVDRAIANKFLNYEAPKEWWQVEPHEVRFLERIGKGSTADVHKGEWNGETVAIKKFHDHRSSVQRELSATLAMATKAAHPNIVRFLAASVNSKPVFVVQEYCGGGTLFHFLHKKPTDGSGISLSLPQKLKMCEDVASAMAYLHSFEPPMLHRDLKSLNLLLAEKLVEKEQEPLLKVADFGLARAKAENMESMTNKVGTIWWMAPEVLQGTHYDEMADVYSFAIVAFEILSENPPFKEMNPIRVSVKVLNGERPNTFLVAPDVPPSLVNVVQRCWAPDTIDRPTFMQVMSFLEKLKHDLLKQAAKNKRRGSPRGSFREETQKIKGAGEAFMRRSHSPPTHPFSEIPYSPMQDSSPLRPSKIGRPQRTDYAVLHNASGPAVARSDTQRLRVTLRKWWDEHLVGPARRMTCRDLAFSVAVGGWFGVFPMPGTSTVLLTTLLLLTRRFCWTRRLSAPATTVCLAVNMLSTPVCFLLIPIWMNLATSYLPFARGHVECSVGDIMDGFGQGRVWLTLWQFTGCICLGIFVWCLASPFVLGLSCVLCYRRASDRQHDPFATASETDSEEAADDGVKDQEATLSARAPSSGEDRLRRGESPLVMGALSIGHASAREMGRIGSTHSSPGASFASAKGGRASGSRNLKLVAAGTLEGGHDSRSSAPVNTLDAAA